MQKNNSKNKMNNTLGEAGPDHIQKLSQQIFDLMENPACPVTLYNAIADELARFAEFIEWHSLEMIEKTVCAYNATDGKKRRVK